MTDAHFRIQPVRTAAEIAATARLFATYASSLEVDLSYQDFEVELATLPGKYAPPAGELLLARGPDREPIGCVGLRPMPTDGCCEMKRLYVSPTGRGLGLGRALADAITDVAVRVGYREMRLDTLPTMAEAIGLYRKLGFEPTEPYYQTPIRDTFFLAKRLMA